jgi:hypothetical protein
VGADDYGTGSGEMAVTSNSRLCAGCGTLVILLALLAVPHALAAAAGRSYDVSNPLALHTGLGTAARPVAPASEGSSFRSGISSSRGGAKADVTQWRIKPPLTDYSEGEGALAPQTNKLFKDMITSGVATTQMRGPRDLNCSHSTNTPGSWAFLPGAFERRFIYFPCRPWAPGSL